MSYREQPTKDENSSTIVVASDVEKSTVKEHEFPFSEYNAIIAALITGAFSLIVLLGQKNRVKITRKKALLHQKNRTIVVVNLHVKGSKSLIFSSANIVYKNTDRVVRESKLLLNYNDASESTAKKLTPQDRQLKIQPGTAARFGIVVPKGLPRQKLQVLITKVGRPIRISIKDDPQNTPSLTNICGVGVCE